MRDGFSFLANEECVWVGVCVWARTKPRRRRRRREEQEQEQAGGGSVDREDKCTDLQGPTKANSGGPRARHRTAQSIVHVSNMDCTPVWWP